MSLFDKIEYVFSFGAHKGKTLRQVATEDPGYLRWAVANVTQPDFVAVIEELRMQRQLISESADRLARFSCGIEYEDDPYDTSHPGHPDNFGDHS